MRMVVAGAVLVLAVVGCSSDNAPPGGAVVEVGDDTVVLTSSDLDELADIAESVGECADWVGEVLEPGGWENGCEIGGSWFVGASFDCVDGSKLWGIGDAGQGGVWGLDGGVVADDLPGWEAAFTACTVTVGQ